MHNLWKSKLIFPGKAIDMYIHGIVRDDHYEILDVIHSSTARVCMPCCIRETAGQ
jgi:hypothetical protein